MTTCKNGGLIVWKKPLFGFLPLKPLLPLFLTPLNKGPNWQNTLMHNRLRNCYLSYKYLFSLD